MNIKNLDTFKSLWGKDINKEKTFEISPYSLLALQAIHIEANTNKRLFGKIETSFSREMSPVRTGEPVKCNLKRVVELYIYESITTSKNALLLIRVDYTLDSIYPLRLEYGPTRESEEIKSEEKFIERIKHHFSKEMTTNIINIMLNDNNTKVSSALHSEFQSTLKLAKEEEE